MANEATATKSAGPFVKPTQGVEYEFTVALGTTHATGYLTVDLTEWFSYITSIKLGGSLGVTGYFVEVQKVAYDTAIDATNVKLFFYEAGADGNPLDLMNAENLTAVITGLTLTVVGKPATVTSWA